MSDLDRIRLLIEEKVEEERKKIQLQRSISNYHLRYRGYVIYVKQDFGGNFHLIDGMPCMWGYIATKHGVLALPGGAWGQTVKEVKGMIDVWIEVGENVELFWKEMQK